MKTKYFNRIAAALIILVAAGCEQKMEIYDYADDGLNFTGEDIEHTFVYSGDIVQDTVWVEISTVGFLSDRPRTIELEQVMLTEEELTEKKDGVADRVVENAESGIHFEPIDPVTNEWMKGHYVMPAQANATKVPVILKRHSSLAGKYVVLRVQLKANDDFRYSQSNMAYIDIEFTDQLTRPNNWNGVVPQDDNWYENQYAFWGPWSRVKHMWLIEMTGDKWDDEYWSTQLGVFNNGSAMRQGQNDNYDSGYYYWYKGKMSAMLAEWVAENGPLVDEFGRTVGFP